MNIYHVIRNDYEDQYDEYSDIVVIAISDKRALELCAQHTRSYRQFTWSNDLKVVLLGISNTNEERIVCASFHAG